MRARGARAAAVRGLALLRVALRTAQKMSEPHPNEHISVRSCLHTIMPPKLVPHAREGLRVRCASSLAHHHVLRPPSSLGRARLQPEELGVEVARRLARTVRRGGTDCCMCSHPPRCCRRAGARLVQSRPVGACRACAVWAMCCERSHRHAHDARTKRQWQLSRAQNLTKQYSLHSLSRGK